MKKLFFFVVALCATVAVNAAEYTKVTTAPADWSGTYILVYEADAYVWNGGDASKTINATTVTITDGKISANDLTEVEIAKVEGGYSIQLLGGANALKYIGGKEEYGNGVVFSETATVNQIALTGGDLAITTPSNDSGTTKNVTLRCNVTTSQNVVTSVFFRYYKSGQKAIQLYKKAETNEPEVRVATSVDFGRKIVERGAFDVKTLSVASKNLKGTLTYKLTSGSEDFEVTGALIDNNGDLTITCKATEVGSYAGELVISSETDNIEETVALTAEIKPITTVAEFLEKKDKDNYYFLEGVVSNITDPTNGRFDLTDSEGTKIYVYNLYTPTGTYGQFATFGIKEGDVLTLSGKYSEYKSEPQVGSARYVSHYTPSSTALENTTTEDVKARKVVENGQIFILKDGVKYNIFGAVVD